MPTEKSQEGIKKRLLVGVVVAGLIAVAFSQLPLRMQGRIIEVCTLGGWPLEWALRRQFARKQPELRSIVEFVNEFPDVERLTVTPLGLQAGVRGNKAEGYNFEKPDILQALLSIQALFVSVHEDRLSVFLGSEIRGSDNFKLSYAYPLAPVDFPDCESITASGRTKIGWCGFKLSSTWYGIYQWYPKDMDELDEALNEFE